MRSLPPLLLSLLLGGLSAREAFACGAAELARLRASAQSLATDAATRGRALLRCPAEADEAAQWLAFALAMSGRESESRTVDPVRLAAARPVPGRAGAIARARAGSYEELLRRVEAAEPGYATAADVQIVLARALMRKGRYDRGLQAYLDYLRLVPADDVAQAEYLFAFIWAKDDAAARARFREASGWRMRPELAAAVARGEALLAKRPATSVAPRTTEAPVAARDTLAERKVGTSAYDLTLGTTAIGDVYRRRTGRVSYEGPIDVAAVGHGVVVSSIETFTQRVAELGIGGRYESESWLAVDGAAGYFVADDASFRGLASVVLGEEAGLHGEAGYEREPLLLMMPLTKDAQMTMRDSIWVGLAFGRYAEVRSRLSKEEDYSAFERHELVLRAPLVSSSGGEWAVFGRIPASLEVHPRPNPNYESDARTTTLGLGFEAEQAMVEGWDARAIVDYNVETAQMRDPSETVNRYSILAVRVEGAWAFVLGWELTLGGVYHHANDPERVEARNLPSGVEIGIGYLPLDE